MKAMNGKRERERERSRKDAKKDKHTLCTRSSYQFHIGKPQKSSFTCQYIDVLTKQSHTVQRSKEIERQTERERDNKE